MKKSDPWMPLLLLVVCLQVGQAAAAVDDITVWEAAADGRVEVIQQYLETGTDVDAKDGRGETLTEDLTCKGEDHALLAAVSAAVLNDKNVKKMPVE